MSENDAENSKMAEGTPIITIVLIGSAQHLKNGCGRRTSDETDFGKPKTQNSSFFHEELGVIM